MKKSNNNINNINNIALLTELPECSVGELPLEDTFKCQLNGYTCTNGDGPQCCSGRDTETRRCVPCEETMHKKPKGTKYTTRGKCTFQAEGIICIF